MDTLDVQEIEVTPELAAGLLKNNSINRRLSRPRVLQYARAMKAGRWTPSNDMVCLDPEGVLLNGQHRLYAVVEANIPVTMTFRYNVPREAMAHMDRQYSRQFTQQLAFRGESNVALLGSTLRLCYLFNQGKFLAGGNTVGDEDMILFLEEHPEVRDSVDVGSKCRTMVQAATPTALSTTHWWLARVAGPDYPAHYLHQLGEPINEPPQSAIHTVRRRLASARGQRWENRNYVYLLTTGWNAYSQGKYLQRPQMAPPNEYKFFVPEPFKWARDSVDVLY